MRIECKGLQGQFVACFLRGRRYEEIGVGIDEADADARAVLCADQQELFSLREVPLDDRQSQRRQQVPLDRPLERAGTEICAEAFLDQEVDRSFVPLDCPGMHPEAASVQQRSEFLLEQRTHDVALERAKHDDAVESVEKLGPEGLLDRSLDRAGCEVVLVPREPQPVSCP